ncbi:ABC transporter ATP-binding protein [Rhodoligotrophos appendicifer]|uniref:ABC transporter ATP-binding protein n=1 Tax=Rhodoligotrophos appendicifer TaxID=987056 RepID=UPI00118648E8|nr:ABC transporter ATP-binding protein [Rhodoligotrophos appendicifer]
MPNELLRLSGVNAGYIRSDVLVGVDLTINEGEVVCLLGSNGAGKTTTIRTISGELKARQGKVIFAGQEIQGQSPAAVVRAGIATVPEGRSIFPQLTVKENLLMGAYSRKRSFQRSEIERAFEMFPRLKERQNQAGGTLSGGEQQMLAISRALMAKPKLLLLDEPSMGLAPILVEMVFETVTKLAAEQVTILLVEQNAEAALEVSQRAYVMERGRIVMQGTSAELRDSEGIRAAYLGGVSK